MSKWTMVFAFALVFGLLGCKKAEAPAEQPAPPAPPKVEAPAQPAAAPAEKPAEQPAAAPAEQPAAPAEQPAPDKDKIKAAYAEVYCAQLKGDSQAVLEAYKKNGFETVDAWTTAWKAASQDVEFARAVMEFAKNQCPAGAPAAGTGAPAAN
jgi:hypothetical protein